LVRYPDVSLHQPAWAVVVGNRHLRDRAVGLDFMATAADSIQRWPLRKLRLGMTRDQVFQVMGTDRKSFDDLFGMTICGSWRTTACDPMAGASLEQHWWYACLPMGSVSLLARVSGQPQVDYWTDGSVTIGVVYRDGKVDQKLMNVRIPSWEKSLRQWLDGI
jgi:hypothetical protein